MSFNYDYTCRICLGKGALTSIFEKRGSAQISAKICSIAKVNISSIDGLPDKICGVCINKLDNCTAFINLCQSSNNKLRSLVHRNSDEDSKTDINIDLYNGHNSLGIEYEQLTEYNPITDDLDNKLLAITEQVIPEVDSKDDFCNEDKNKSRQVDIKEKLNVSDKKKTLKLQCSTCGKVMSSKFRLKTHLSTHTGERPFSCHHCKKSFSLLQNLKVHMRIHTGEKPLRCSVCGMSFAQSAGLATHKLKHTGQTPYPCVLCQRSFRTKGHLQYHLRQHTGEKNFECDICNKDFITRSGLKQHLLTHTGIKPHVCVVCDKRMSRVSHLKRHLQQAHQGLYPCNKCPAKFKQKSDFEKHKESHDDEKA